jgi:hypothetical protein
VRVILHRDETPLTASSRDSRSAHFTSRRDSSDDGVDVLDTRHPAKRAHHKAGGKRNTGVLLAPQSSQFNIPLCTVLSVVIRNYAVHHGYACFACANGVLQESDFDSAFL